MSPSVIVRCPAKLNLFLEVLGRRPDGYHEIETVMHAIDLCDELRILPLESDEVALACDAPDVPTGEDNLVVKAARLLKQATGYRGGARIDLVKRIPPQSGLGGGSSDGAGALVGLNEAWGLGLSPEELRRLAAELGSDVAFFLTGGSALCTGRGERVQGVPCGRELDFVVVCPAERVSTAEAYGRLPCALTWPRVRARMLLDALAEGDAAKVGRCLFNRLEQAAFGMAPSLSRVKAHLVGMGCFSGVALSGSGSALYGVVWPGAAAEAFEAARSLGAGRVHRVRSVPHGVLAQLA